jgi:[ribosomal protein S18]-alanine N-acetyltransferase
MTLSDLEQTTRIDALSFPIPWSRSTYLYEITQNENSHMLVLVAPPAMAQPVQVAAQANLPDETKLSAANSSSMTGVQRRLGLLSVVPLPEPTPDVIVGLGGFWCAVGEAHISTIAVHPDWRGRGLGEALLASMLKLGMALGAKESVLEVRISNQIAIGLYRKYGYKVLTRRKRYYRDNNEDAWLMQVDMGKAFAARFAGLWEAITARVPLVDQVDQDDPA